jgi:hypothetical protein
MGRLLESSPADLDPVGERAEVYAFTRQGQRRGEGGDREVCVAVEDNGIGISPTVLPHIFERFYRADPSRSQVEGTGLGLAIAKWIVDAHCARIWVESRGNGGCVFQIAFPVFEGTSIPSVTADHVLNHALTMPERKHFEHLTDPRQVMKDRGRQDVVSEE